MKESGINILCTLGPSSMHDTVIKRLADMGTDLFRINLSHTAEIDIEETILKISRVTDVPICIDTEGAQVRNGMMVDGMVRYSEGSSIRIHRDEVVGDASKLSLKPSFVLDQIEVGDLISLDFDSVLLGVTRKAAQYVEARVLSEGSVGSNRAVTIDRPIELPPLSRKDRVAIDIGLRLGIHYYALSFAGHKEDVEMLRRLVGDKTHIMCKIENREGIRNLSDILSVADSILIDRGDLSREIPLEKIPIYQKKIIQEARKAGVPVNVATNLLESMTVNKYPTRAELNDIVKTLEDGATGLVLAAETAIGAYPIACLNMINKVTHSYRHTKGKDVTLDIMVSEPNSYLTLVEPHGGSLVHRVGTLNPDIDLSRLPRLKVDQKALIDIDQIATGVYSPVEGFMTREEIHAVLDDNQLPDGSIWTLPIVLPCDKTEMANLSHHDKIALVSEDNEIYAVLHLEDVYEFDSARYVNALFRTDDERHPGVKILYERGNCLLGGKIDAVRRYRSQLAKYLYTPTQVRHIFEKKGWHTIVGFHTRNVVHRAHEYIQITSLQQDDIDGLFIHPVVGPKKPNDYRPEIILSSYEMVIEKYYPKGSVVLSAFNSYSHYAGPREAVFTALCRKNFGCTHFIVGRDHTGVGKYYKPDAAMRLFEALGDIGITPVFYEEVYYLERTGRYVHDQAGSTDDRSQISGTDARKMLQSGQLPPEWFMRREVAELILEEIEAGHEVFVQ